MLSGFRHASEMVGKACLDETHFSIKKKNYFAQNLRYHHSITPLHNLLSAAAHSPPLLLVQIHLELTSDS